MTIVQVNYVIAKRDKLKRTAIENQRALKDMRKQIVIVWFHCMNYLDPDEAPWTPEYRERMAYINHHRQLTDEEVCLELLDDEHEKALLHHA